MEDQYLKIRIEPGILAVFKLYLWVRLGLMILLSVITLVFADFSFDFDIIPYIVVFVTDLTFLIVFLVIDQPKKMLGGAYLPIALAVVSFTTILESQFLFNNALDQDITIWLLFATLSIPLLITAWQWDLKRVYLFSFGTAVFEFFLVYANFPQDQYRNITVLSIILVRTAMFILMGYIVTLLMEEQRKQRSKVHEANRLLIRYSDRIRNMAVVQERNRMIRELHDTLAHSLSGLVVQLDAMAMELEDDTAEHQERINEILAYARKGLGDTRRAMQDLKTSELEDLGLRYALEKYIDDLKRMSDIQISFEWNTRHTQNLDIYEHTIFRIIQEAMKNAVVHSGAQNLWLEIRENSEDIEIQIRDDGKGFNTSSQEIRGFGLDAMQDRAENIGAGYQIESDSEQGTKIVITLRMEYDQSVDL